VCVCARVHVHTATPGSRSSVAGWNAIVSGSTHNVLCVGSDGDSTRGGHSIVKLKTTCEQNKYTFFKLHHQNGSNFYQIFFMSGYTWYLLHSRN
jgi:hypothetical protein